VVPLLSEVSSIILCILLSLETYTITANLYNEDGTLADDNILIGNNVVNISSIPTSAFTDLRIQATKRGKYYLVFDSGMYSTLNQNRRVNITIVPGFLCISFFSNSNDFRTSLFFSFF
jgi:hypothetical protein